MDIKQMRGKTKNELLSEVIKADDELVTKRQAITLGKDKKVSEVRTMSRSIAKLKTILREKEILEGIK